MAPHSSTLAWKIPWTEEPGRLQSMGSLRVGHNWATSLSCIGEGNGNPLQCSCLENPTDGGAWWAAVYGVAQSRTRLKWLSRGNRRRFRVRQPILHYRWDVSQRLGEPQARMREENMERIGEEVRQLMEKLKEKQLSHSLWAVSTDPPLPWASWWVLPYALNPDVFPEVRRHFLPKLRCSWLTFVVKVLVLNLFLAHFLLPASNWMLCFWPNL